jgi:hypothetical protein
VTSAPSKWWWLLLLTYPVSGLALGLLDPALGRAAQQLGTRPGMATAVTVNLLLPLVAVALGLAHGRVGRAWLGALAMTLGLSAGLAAWYPPRVLNWSPAGPLGVVPPVLVGALLGYAFLGTAAALVARAWPRPSASNGTPPV